MYRLRSRQSIRRGSTLQPHGSAPFCFSRLTHTYGIELQGSTRVATYQRLCFWILLQFWDMHVWPTSNSQSTCHRLIAIVSQDVPVISSGPFKCTTVQPCDLAASLFFEPEWIQARVLYFQQSAILSQHDGQMQRFYHFEACWGLSLVGQVSFYMS